MARSQAGCRLPLPSMTMGAASAMALLGASLLFPLLKQAVGNGLGWCCLGMGLRENLGFCSPVQLQRLGCHDLLSSQDPRCWCLALPGA